jgi:hypothetical protein
MTETISSFDFDKSNLEECLDWYLISQLRIARRVKHFEIEKIRDLKDKLFDNLLFFIEDIIAGDQFEEWFEIEKTIPSDWLMHCLNHRIFAFPTETMLGLFKGYANSYYVDKRLTKEEDRSAYLDMIESRI